MYSCRIIQAVNDAVGIDTLESFSILLKSDPDMLMSCESYNS